MISIGIFAAMRILYVVSAASNIQDKTLAEIPTAPSRALSPASYSAKSSSLARFCDQTRFHELFPNAIELYNFNGLVDAANKYPEFANTGNDVDDKPAEEYARNTYDVWQYCDNTTYPCAPGRRYHGRGPIQLSWNYNYYNAGEALGIDLLDNPDIVATNTTVTWMTTLWYWMTPQAGRVIHDVVTKMNGFAISTDIINGGLECGPDAPNKENELQRIRYFTRMCDALGVQPLGNVSCNDLQT